MQQEKGDNYSTFQKKIDINLLSHSHVLMFPVWMPWFSEKAVAELFTFQRKTVNIQTERKRERKDTLTPVWMHHTRQDIHTHAFTLVFKSGCWNVLTGSCCLITDLSSQDLSTVRLCVFLCFPGILLIVCFS